MVDSPIFRRDVEDFINSSFTDGPIRRINLWMEVLGPVCKPVWFCFDGVPLHDACKVECRRFLALVWDMPWRLMESQPLGLWWKWLEFVSL